MTLHWWFSIALIVTLGIRFLSFRYIYGLRRFNGPLLASFTDVWRFLYHVRKQGVPFRDLHDHYGDIVRVGPNVLSFRDPQAVRDIFGAGLNWGKVRSSQWPVKALSINIANECLVSKSDFYTISAAVTKGKSTPTLFSSTDAKWHKNVRKAVNPFFTQTTVLTYETFVERTIEIFITEMDRRFAGKDGTEGAIDLHTWLSYFAFDVMSDLTYSKHHGFVSRGEDVHGIVGWVGKFLEYGWVVS